MSFFKKLANEFEKLDFGSDDKDKRKNEAQPQSSRGKHGPNPRCAASRRKLQAGRRRRRRAGSPSCPSSLPTAGAPRPRKPRPRQHLSHFLFLPPTIMLTPSRRLPPATIRPPAAAVRRRPQPSAATGVRRLLRSGLCRPPTLGPGLPAPRRQAPAPGRVGPAVGRAVPALVLRRAGHRPHPMGGSRI